MSGNYKNYGNRKIFLDLDGVCAKFSEARDKMGLTSAEYKILPGAYRNLELYDGVAENVEELLKQGFDIWVATKIPFANPAAATEKLLWVEEKLPLLKKSVIITPNKGCLGDVHDILIDDRPHKAHCSDFKGIFMGFGPYNEFKNWEVVMEFLATIDARDVR